jgi:hypothetical protein
LRLFWRAPLIVIASALIGRFSSGFIDYVVMQLRRALRDCTHYSARDGNISHQADYCNWSVNPGRSPRIKEECGVYSPSVSVGTCPTLQKDGIGALSNIFSATSPLVFRIWQQQDHLRPLIAYQPRTRISAAPSAHSLLPPSSPAEDRLQIAICLRLVQSFRHGGR